MRTVAPMASRFDLVPTSRNRRLRLPASLIVAEEHGGPVVGRHQQVDVAVAVEVAAREAAADARLREPAARRRTRRRGTSPLP